MIVRLLLPVLFQSMMKKAQNQANQRYQEQQRQANPDGKIRVDYMPPKTKSPGDTAGDFVEYEEIKS